MKTLYLECNMGAAGDMLMAALTELMPNKDAFVKELNDLRIPQVNIERTTIAKCGIMGTHMVVTVCMCVHWNIYTFFFFPINSHYHMCSHNTA